MHLAGYIQPRSQGPLLPVPCPSPEASERETLENAVHVSPRIWEMTKHNIGVGAANFYHYSWLASPSLFVMFCHLPDSGRHATSIFQGLSLALAPQGTGRRGPWERGWSTLALLIEDTTNQTESRQTKSNVGLRWERKIWSTWGKTSQNREENQLIQST